MRHSNLYSTSSNMLLKKKKFARIMLSYFFFNFSAWLTIDKLKWCLCEYYISIEICKIIIILLICNRNYKYFDFNSMIYHSMYVFESISKYLAQVIIFEYENSVTKRQMVWNNWRQNGMERGKMLKINNKWIKYAWELCSGFLAKQLVICIVQSVCNFGFGYTIFKF